MSFTRYLAPSFFAALTMLSLWLGFENASAATALAVARQVADGGKFDRESVQRVLADYETVLHQSCRSDIIGAGLILHLADLDAASVVEYRDWQQAVASAAVFIGHASRCTPADGNLWLRDAMISRSIAEVPGEVAAKVRTAQMLHPAELGSLLGRIALYRQLTPASLALVSDVVKADFATLFAFGSRTLVRELAQVIEPKLRPAAFSAAIGLTIERQNELLDLVFF